jgi:hypothetical protein
MNKENLFTVVVLIGITFAYFHYVKGPRTEKKNKLKHHYSQVVKQGDKHDIEEFEEKYGEFLEKFFGEDYREEFAEEYEEDIPVAIDDESIDYEGENRQQSGSNSNSGSDREYSSNQNQKNNCSECGRELGRRCVCENGYSHCSRCDGTGYRNGSVCLSCRGEGFGICPDCDGTGNWKHDRCMFCVNGLTWLLEMAK